MPPRKRRALVDLQNRDPATGRWLPGKKKPVAVNKKSVAGKKKPGARKKKPVAGKKKPGARKKKPVPLPTRSDEAEAEAMEMGRADAADEMRDIRFWDIWDEVGVSQEKIKQIEKKIPQEKAKKKVDLKILDGLEDDLAMEKGRKMEFQDTVIQVSQKEAPHFWRGEVQEERV